MLTNEEMLAVQEAIQYIEIFKQIMICLLICGAKILEISIQSVKTVCMVKGQKLVSAVLGFIECMVWGLVVSSVITTLSEDFTLLFSYCLGYALGLYLGSIIESKIALGTSSVQIMVSKEHIDAVEGYLKENNHGFTILDGRGSKEAMFVVIMVLPRKEVKSTIKDIRNLCGDDVFIVSSEVSKFVGGYGVKK